VRPLKTSMAIGLDAIAGNFGIEIADMRSPRASG
jgi:hypothetical protein